MSFSILNSYNPFSHFVEHTRETVSPNSPAETASRYGEAMSYGYRRRAQDGFPDSIPEEVSGLAAADVADANWKANVAFMREESRRGDVARFAIQGIRDYQTRMNSALNSDDEDRFNALNSELKGKVEEYRDELEPWASLRYNGTEGEKVSRLVRSVLDGTYLRDVDSGFGVLSRGPNGKATAQVPYADYIEAHSEDFKKHRARTIMDSHPETPQMVAEAMADRTDPNHVYVARDLVRDSKKDASPNWAWRSMKYGAIPKYAGRFSDPSEGARFFNAYEDSIGSLAGSAYLDRAVDAYLGSAAPGSRNPERFVETLSGIAKTLAPDRYSVTEGGKTVTKAATDTDRQAAFGVAASFVKAMSGDGIDPSSMIPAYSTALSSAYRAFSDYRKVLGIDPWMSEQDPNGEIVRVAREMVEGSGRSDTFNGMVAFHNVVGGAFHPLGTFTAADPKNPKFDTAPSPSAYSPDEESARTAFAAAVYKERRPGENIMSALARVSSDPTLMKSVTGAVADSLKYRIKDEALRGRVAADLVGNVFESGAENHRHATIEDSLVMASGLFAVDRATGEVVRTDIQPLPAVAKLVENGKPTNALAGLAATAAPIVPKTSDSDRIPDLAKNAARKLLEKTVHSGSTSGHAASRTRDEFYASVTELVENMEGLEHMKGVFGKTSEVKTVNGKTKTEKKLESGWGLHILAGEDLSSRRFGKLGGFVSDALESLDGNVSRLAESDPDAAKDLAATAALVVKNMEKSTGVPPDRKVRTSKTRYEYVPGYEGIPIKVPLNRTSGFELLKEIAGRVGLGGALPDKYSDAAIDTFLRMIEASMPESARNGSFVFGSGFIKDGKFDFESGLRKLRSDRMAEAGSFDRAAPADPSQAEARRILASTAMSDAGDRAAMKRIENHFRSEGYDGPELQTIMDVTMEDYRRNRERDPAGALKLIDNIVERRRFILPSINPDGTINPARLTDYGPRTDAEREDILRTVVERNQALGNTSAGGKPVKTYSRDELLALSVNGPYRIARQNKLDSEFAERSRIEAMKQSLKDKSGE